MWRVLFVLTVLSAPCEPYSKRHKPAPTKNQRIIKVQGPPHFNHFHGHSKPFRKRPFGPHAGEEFIRPNHLPPIPPFFNGPSTNHIKHPRPPPHVFHKSPSYGLGFPYKTSLSHRPPAPSKDKFHTKGVSSSAVRTVVSSSSVSSGTTYLGPKFSTPSFVSSPPVSHIISSDDNNGPIREIPAPNLAPKPHDIPFDGVVGDLGGIGGVSGIGGVGGIGLNAVNIHGIGGVGGVSDVSVVGGIHGVGDGGLVGGIHGVGDGGVVGGLHGVGDGGVVGGIHGVGDVGVGGGVGVLNEVSGGGEIHGVGGIGDVGSFGGVSHLEAGELLNTVAKKPNGVNLDAIVQDQGVEVHPYLQESGGDAHHGKEPTVEIANFDEGSSIDVTNLIKNAAGTSGHHSGYEVTEHHNHLPSNDQIIKGHDGSKLYYAPDPDPSLPVQKVPPTSDPHSTPSNGQHINSIFLQQVPHGYPYVQGGALGAPLSSQELFHLMHGYPAVIPQPVVAFVSQPQAQGVVLPGGGHNYFQQNSGGYGGHYPQEEHGENDISQYLRQPDIHNLLHNSPGSSQEILGGHSSVVSQSVSSPQSQHRTKSDESSLDSSSGGGFPTSSVSHNFQYEPEASESDSRNGLTVIRQSNEGTLTSETVKELLLEDSASNELNQREKNAPVSTVLRLKNIPEVPFYASLPNKKAAEALASLQAAGSIASDYMSKVKALRGQEEGENDRRRKLGSEEGREKTVVEIQESVPLYESSISSKNLVERDDEEEQSADSEPESSQENPVEQEFSNLDFKEDNSNESFGKRIRPK